MSSSSSTTSKSSKQGKAERKSQQKSTKNAARRDAQVIDGEVRTKQASKSNKSKSKSKAKSQSKAKTKVETKTKTKREKLTAKTADPHRLYQAAVQSPEVDVEFLAKTYRRMRGKPARHLREDFCGTAYLLSEWLRAHDDNTGEGFDIDAPTIEWGKQHNFDGLEDWNERAELHVADVREPSSQRPDIRNAPNFSWMVLTERSVMMDYFRGAYADLADDGIFVLDIYGGPEAFEEMEDSRKIEGGFTYVWEQKSYYPATGDYHCAIHFRFKDGTELKNVYDYRWRLWTLPELRDMLFEAGFTNVESYWEGTDEDGVSGNGIYKRSERGDNCPAWVTWVVAEK